MKRNKVRLGESDYGGTMVLGSDGIPFAYVYSLADARRVVQMVNAAASEPPTVAVKCQQCKQPRQILAPRLVRCRRCNANRAGKSEQSR
jgi:hypothetical protein